MRFKWTAEEIEKLRKFYPRSSWNALLEIFPKHTIGGIKTAACRAEVKKIRYFKGKPVMALKHLRKRRLEIGVSQLKVSEIMGYGEQEISNWETGLRPPNKFQIQCYRDTLDRFEALGLNI